MISMDAVFHGFDLVVVMMMMMVVVAVEKYGLLRSTKFNYVWTIFTPHAGHTETKKQKLLQHTHKNIITRKETQRLLNS